MQISGKLIKGTTLLREEWVVVEGDKGSYQDKLEYCLMELCRKLNIEVPMWLTKNTREYVRYRRTSFYADQFFNPVMFERFEIKLESD